MAPATCVPTYYAYISGSWVLLDDRIPASARWGLADNSPTTRLSDPGVLNVTLNNSTGIYSPDGPSALAGWKKGIPFKAVFTFEGQEYIRFRGTIEDIQISADPRNRSVAVTVLTWMNQAQTYPIINPDLLQDVTADEAITSILSGMPIQPLATDLDAGIAVFPTVLDTVKENTRAYNEFAKLSLSELGVTYEKHDKVYGNTLVFESLDHRNGTNQLKEIPKATADSGLLLMEDGDSLLTEAGDFISLDELETAYVNEMAVDLDITYGDKIVNNWKSNAYPKRIDTEVVQLYQTEKPIYLAPNVPYTFRGFFTNPTGKSRINAIPPTQNDYVKSVMHFDDNSFTDELGNIWTNNGVDIIQNVKKIGDGAAYFDGSSAWISTPTSPDWEFGSGDFTVEWWEYRFNATNNTTSINRNYASAFPAFQFGKADGTNSKVYISSNGSSFDIANGKTFGAATLNTWVHLAICRSGNNWYTFKNGVLADSWTASGTLLATSAVLSLGRNSSTYLTAVIDELIIEKGVARYTAGFTPRTTPYQQEGTFGQMNTNQDMASGTNISDSLSITPDYGTEGATFTLLNSYTSGGWATLATSGYGIYSDSPLEDTQEDAGSIASYGYKNDGIQQQYQQDVFYGVLEGKRQVELNKQPRTDLNKIYLCANKSPFLMQAFLNVDIGDMVHIKSAAQGINGYYYVQGVEFDAKGVIVNFAWIVKRAFTFENGLSDISVEFFGTDLDDAVNFGYIPLVAADEVTYRAFSAWVNLDSLSATKNRAIIGNYMGSQGFLLYVDNHATNRIMAFYKQFDGGTAGQWSAPVNAFNLSSWVHVIVFFNHTSASNDPIMYINGSLQTLTENLTPTGSATSEVGADIVIGNYNHVTEGYDAAWDGKIKDVRVYNMDKTTVTPAALAAGLNGEGAFGTGYYEGLAFRAFSVRTPDLTAYTDLTLTDETKVLDGYAGFVGDPKGSPVSRIP